MTRILALILLLTSAGAALADETLNPNAYLASDPTGEEQAAAPSSPAALKRFIMDAAWDNRMWLAEPCGFQTDLWQFRLEVSIRARIMRAIDASNPPSTAEKRLLQWRAEGSIDAAATGAGMMAIRHRGLTCRAVLSQENMDWMRPVIESEIHVSNGDIGPPGTVSNGAAETLRNEQAAETAFRCGLRDAAWLTAVHAAYHDGEQRPDDHDAYGHVSLPLQDAYTNGVFAMFKRWATWEASQMPDGGCQTVLRGKDLAYDDGLVRAR